ncbi:MAG: J domain-containing protein [Pseudomonadota bacterium]
MSYAEDYGNGFRVKFVDVRVKPPGGKRVQPDAETRVCEHKGCDLPGVCRAPKQTAAALKRKRKRDEDFHWFCARHAAEYNKAYNFFDGMTETEYAAFQAAERAGHQKTWRFGTGPMGGAKSAHANDPRRWGGRHFFDENGERVRPETQKPGRTRLQLKSLEALHLPHDATAEAVRERYADLVKKYHPDSNGGDRSMEQRLGVVIRAFKTLKAAGLA